MAHKGVVFLVLFSLVCGAKRVFLIVLFSLVCGAQRSGFYSFVFVSLWRTKEWF